MDTILKKFWSHYSPYQLHPEDGDYLDLHTSEYCLDLSIDDMRLEYGEDLSRVSVNNKFKKDSSKNNKILSRLYPVPFFGNVLHAKVYILTGNPGFATWCFIEDYENQEYINLLQENLKLSMNTPFNIHSSLATTGGYEYWKPKYERIINAVANKSDWNRTKAEKIVHENVAVIESVAYHSNKRPPDKLFNLPSSQLNKEFVQNYVLKRVRSNQALIFAWRAASHWELDANEDNILVRNPRAAIGDINPDEINAMGDFIVKGSLQREKSDPIEFPDLKLDMIEVSDLPLFNELEKKVTINVNEFNRKKLSTEESNLIKKSAPSIVFKEIMNRHTLRDITHIRGQPQTVITEYGCALGFSFTINRKKSYLAPTKKIMNSFYEEHQNNEKIIITNDKGIKMDLGINICKPSNPFFDNWIWVVWVADFKLNEIGKLYVALRAITKNFKF